MPSIRLLLAALLLSSACAVAVARPTSAAGPERASCGGAEASLARADAAFDSNDYEGSRAAYEACLADPCVDDARSAYASLRLVYVFVELRRPDDAAARLADARRLAIQHAGRGDGVAREALRMLPRVAALAPASRVSAARFEATLDGFDVTPAERVEALAELGSELEDHGHPREAAGLHRRAAELTTDDDARCRELDRAVRALSSAGMDTTEAAAQRGSCVVAPETPPPPQSAETRAAMELARGILRRRLAGARRCYEDALRRRPDLSGPAVEFDYVATPRPHLARRGSSGDSTLDDCLDRFLERLDLQSSEGETVALPFNFSVPLSDDPD